MGLAKGESSVKAELLQSAVSPPPGSYMGSAYIPQICCTQPPKLGKTHCKCRELLLRPRSCGMWGSPVQTETDGERGKTLQSLPLCPYSAPFLSANTDSPLLLTVHTHVLLPALPYSFLLLPLGPPRHLQQQQSFWIERER